MPGKTTPLQAAASSSSTPATATTAQQQTAKPPTPAVITPSVTSASHTKSSPGTIPNHVVRTGGTGAGASASAGASSHHTSSLPPLPQPQTQQPQVVTPITPSSISSGAPSPLPSHLAPTITGSGTYYHPNFAADRPILVASREHLLHDANATAIPPPRPTPIDYDSNPDVLALQSTIAILQLQKKRAAEDIVKLKRAKDAALAEPGSFVEDLRAGRVGQSGSSRPMLHQHHRQGRGGEDNSADSSSGSDDEDAMDEESDSPLAQTKTRPWETLPQPQNLARMPAINWTQYGVVGESLDKLHDEQRTRPSPGAPATIRPDGSFDVIKAGQGGQGPGQEAIGVMAPFHPLKNKVEKKAKSSKR